MREYARRRDAIANLWWTGSSKPATQEDSMPISRRALFVSTVAVATAACAAKSSATQIDAARAAVRAALAKTPVPGFSVAVVRGVDLIWAEAFGKADLELGVNATPAHRFRLGSVSKTFTATLAAVLAARGVVDLDGPISNHLPGLPAQHRGTTLRQLLTHRGGIRHYKPDEFGPNTATNIDARIYRSNADILAIFIDDPLVAKPGEKVEYSTFGYTLASLVLEAAAKLPFLELLQRDVTGPLGLTTVRGDAPFEIVPDRVRGYHLATQAAWTSPPVAGTYVNVPTANPMYKWAGGGLIATPSDVARFGAAHFAPGKLPAAALKTLFSVNVEGTANSATLGLGWRLSMDTRKRVHWSHAGGLLGARANLVVHPEQKLSIAFASNLTGVPGDVNALSFDIANALTTA
jgi:serine beta-lactamase-like protein LACTB